MVIKTLMLALFLQLMGIKAVSAEESSQVYSMSYSSSETTSSFDADSSTSDWSDSSSGYEEWRYQKWQHKQWKRRHGYKEKSKRLGSFLEKEFHKAHITAHEIYVDAQTPLPKRLQNGSAARPFSSLQVALDLAQDLAADCRSVDDGYTIVIRAGDYMPDPGYDSFEVTGNAALSLLAMGEVSLKKRDRITFLPIDVANRSLPRYPPVVYSPLIRWSFEPMPIQNNYLSPALHIISLHKNMPCQIYGGIEVVGGSDTPVTLELQAHVHGDLAIEEEAQVTLRNGALFGALTATRSDLTTAEATSFYGPIGIGMYGIIDRCQIFGGMKLHATQLKMAPLRPSIVLQSYLAGTYEGPNGTFLFVDVSSCQSLQETHAVVSEEFLKKLS